MELDITDFFDTACPRDYSASVAEKGANAGPDTWHAACDASDEYTMLDTDDKRDAFRAFVCASGGWDADEIAAWPDTELNALCLQWIAGDMRECGMRAGMDDLEWSRVKAQQSEGHIPSRLSRGDDGRVYFDIGV